MRSPKITFIHPLNILRHGELNQLLTIMNRLLGSKIINKYNTLKNISNFALVLDDTDGKT